MMIMESVVFVGDMGHFCNNEDYESLWGTVGKCGRGAVEDCGDWRI